MSRMSRVEILPREVVERVARIAGHQSAAAQALRCVDSGEHGPDAVIARPLGSGWSGLIVTPKSNITPAVRP